MTVSEDQDWVSVAQYSSATAASLDAGLLTSMSIPNKIRHYPRTLEWYIWVPPEFAEALEPAQISEAELTEQALQEPPPDDA